ncbi:MAG TPA: alpha-galactosidase [Candidatus Hydrogenedentes bacterium]|nr:alpha-galactosidase [Candidatus Hydrogenedentota bacterium]HNT86973.1 alpha-galactosidase [Candidatus Hydrogenedentota bacterium]
MSVKIVLVGAGSRSFAPLSVRDILLSEPLRARGVELVLMDIVAEHLIEIEQYAREVAATLKHDVRVWSTTDLDAALDGADFVIAAIEVDRYLYWVQDFHVPRKHGFRQVYGENGGPGGIFHALRNMGPIVHIARTMERRCPEAWLINFTNPESKLCEAVCRLTKTRNVGLCHGVYHGFVQTAHILGMAVEDIEGAACGINHFTWFQVLRDKKTGEDLYPRLRACEARGDWLAEWHEYGMARILFRRFGLWPSPAPNHYGEYVRWAEEFVCSEVQYFHDPMDGPPWRTGDIPEFVYSLSGDKTTRPWIKPDPSPTRFQDAPLEASDEFAVPIIEGIACGVKHDLLAINVPNGATIPNLPEDMVIEAPGVADADGVRTVPMAPLPEGIAAMLRLQGSIHKLLVEAFAERSKNKLVQTFLLDPTVDSYRRAVECIDEMLALQKDILPEFK